MIREAIDILVTKKDLTSEEMQQVMLEIFSGATETADIVNFLTALNAKGETVQEITAAVTVMLKFVEPIIVDKPNILDTCGTGGDRKGTFNISTTVAFVASGAGAIVAKHGNRSVSSKCGSADILEALGVAIAVDRARIKKCLEEIGIAFLFAPNLHPVMKHVMPARKEIGTKTMFNVLGPLINPARATNQLIGVYSPHWTGILARVLYNLGTHHVLVVHGRDGLDEVTTTDATIVSEMHNGTFSEYEIAPEDYGLMRSRLENLQGAGISQNVAIIMGVLRGSPGAHRDIVLLNAGCALYAANKTGSIRDGIALAEESIDSGNALRKLELLKEYSHGGA